MKPTRQQETGIALITAAILLLIILLTMGGCATKKVVEERVYVHDTLYIYHSDTIRDYKVERDTVVDWKVITKHDTLYHEIERAVTLNERGDTISQREWERLWQKIHELESARHDECHSDSASYLQAENDSLQAIIDSRQEQVVEVKKSPLPRIRDMIVAALIIIVVTVALLRRK